ncbi:MAG: hypothetical protein L6Q37_10525 [Bdellovibrionaceae bacterium]|nr:hypothetical protein [Pseudobdellovibrionaceae bacterium]NUM60415.1 hypothetical protein [Pseudobdellovibrionaceae bacterium]
MIIESVIKKVLVIFFLVSSCSLGAELLANQNKKTSGQNLISQVVGVAGENVVTSREVQIVNLLEKAQKGSEELKLIDSEDMKFSNEISQVLIEIVVMSEANVFDLSPLKKEEFESESARLQKKLAASSDWKKLQVSSLEFEKFLRRKMVAKKFINLKSDSMKGIISDQEAKDYFEKNRLKFGQVPFTEFKENIKTFLSQQQLEERLTAWFEVIKKKYKVKNYQNEIRSVM